MTQLAALYRRLTEGAIDRRAFAQRALALGVAPAIVTTIAANAQTPQASPATSGEPLRGTRPDAGTEGQTRGEGGDLRVLVPQAASALSVHNATGGKDIAAGSIINEALLDYDAAGLLVANLATEVPSLQNGQLAADLSSVTFSLREGVTWSDGTPFTAADVEFTWQWNIAESNGSIDAASWQLIAAAEVIDDLTITLTFAEPTLGWFQPFGSNIGAIYPRHFWDGKDAATANAEFATAPIGTGAFMVESFAANDQVIYAANPAFREPNKPFYSRLILKGGGDPSSAVTAVTKTGDWDAAFTLQIDPDALRAALGDQGTVFAPAGTGVEKIQFNFSDPNTEVAGQRSQKDTPHPFLTDPAVREAIATAIDRDTIAERLYGVEGGGVNLLAGLPAYESPNTAATYDPEAANALLESAGWVRNGDVREKDGVRLSVKYVTTNVQQRTKAQAVVKDNLVAIGFDVQLEAVDGSIFFDGDVANTQNFTHFYSDFQQYTDGATSAFPLNYMKYWYAGPDGENIAQAENGYTGTNKTRYANAEYDAAWERIAGLTDAADATDLFVQLNDHVVENHVEIALVTLPADRYVLSNTIDPANVVASPFGDLYWNLRNWRDL